MAETAGTTQSCEHWPGVFERRNVVNKLRWIALAVILPGLAACSAAVSTQDVERAAMDRARQQLGLEAGTNLDAKVWTGKEHDGDLTYCGTVSSQEGAARAIPPQRFAASGDPLEFLVFEDAHAPMVTSQPDKFVSWEQLCVGQQPA